MERLMLSMTPKEWKKFGSSSRSRRGARRREVLFKPAAEAAAAADPEAEARGPAGGCGSANPPTLRMRPMQRRQARLPRKRGRAEAGAGARPEPEQLTEGAEAAGEEAAKQAHKQKWGRSTTEDAGRRRRPPCGEGQEEEEGRQKQEKKKATASAPARRPCCAAQPLRRQDCKAWGRAGSGTEARTKYWKSAHCGIERRVPVAARRLRVAGGQGCCHALEQRTNCLHRCRHVCQASRRSPSFCSAIRVIGRGARRHGLRRQAVTALTGRARTW